MIVYNVDLDGKIIKREPFS